MTKKARPWLSLLLALGLLLGLSGAALADHHAVKVAEAPELGKFLTDAKGMTLYWFAKDSQGVSACAGDCLVKWPAYFRAQVAATGGLKAEDFSTITRADGAQQTAYKGKPLYYFFQDKAPGETKGHKVNQVWFVVNP